MDIEGALSSVTNVYQGIPMNEPGYLCLRNGVYDKKEKKLLRHSPDIFLIGSCSYSYEPEAQCPRFMEFLADFCQGYEDRINMIRSFMWAVLNNYTDPQIFLYISGPAATGKSVFTHTLTALLPPEAVVTTRLKDLNQDKFEVVNLSWKELVIMSDVEEYTGDMSVLKAFVGQDILKGSRKYVQGTFSVEPTGLLMVLANHPFSSHRDAGGALARRLLPFSADKVSVKRVPLITRRLRKGYQGVLADELPGILNWVMAWDQRRTHRYLSDTTSMVPSLSSFIHESRMGISGLGEWTEDSLSVDPGSVTLVGTAQGGVDQLYPNYIHYVKDRGGRPIGHRRFIADLKNLLIQRRVDFKYSKTRQGMAFEGISLGHMEEVEANPSKGMIWNHSKASQGYEAYSLYINGPLSELQERFNAVSSSLAST